MENIGGNEVEWTNAGMETVPDHIREQLEYLHEPEGFGWTYVDEGGYSEVYECDENPSLILKLWNAEHFDSIGSGLVKNDDYVMKMIGADDRIPTLYGSCESFVLMSRMNGETLSDIFSVPVNLETVHLIENQVHSFIQDMLDRGIVPLDLNTDNILYDEFKERVEFIDFGLYGFRKDPEWIRSSYDELFSMAFGEYKDHIASNFEEIYEEDLSKAG